MTPSAPWITLQTRQLLAQQGHAWLLSGPSGLGQMALALALVRAWLCERPSPDGACLQCGSCHAIDVHTHADLAVLMPETHLLELGWPLPEKAADEIESKKRKPSKDIRVEAMRDVVEFAQRTSARGRGKAVLIYPAERMNTITANALLKTLEEPVGNVKFVLASQAAHLLLPTIRSRCLNHTLHWPEHDQALQWLTVQGVDAEVAAVALRAAGGRPQDALDMLPLVSMWGSFPRCIAHGEWLPFKDFAPLQLVDLLQKIAHDTLTVQCGAAPRFFEIKDLPKRTALPALAQWVKALAKQRLTIEHPFNPGLLQEALLSQAQLALNSRA